MSNARITLTRMYGGGSWGPLMIGRGSSFLRTGFSGLFGSAIFSSSDMRSLWEREREMFDLTTHSTHFIYGYMASDIWLRTILIVRKETRCRHIGYSYRLTARVLLYAPSHRQDNTYHSLCYTSRGVLAGTRNSSMGPPHEGSIWRPIAPWANALPLSYVPLPRSLWGKQILHTLFTVKSVQYILTPKFTNLTTD